MDVLSMLRKSSMIAGLLVAGVKLIDLAARISVTSTSLIGIVPVLLLVFGAFFVGTRGFGNQKADIRANAYAIGAGLMILAFIGGNLIPSAAAWLLPLSLVLIVIAVALAAVADMLARKYEAA